MARGLRSPDEMARSDSLLLRAVEVDPTYALAHAELAANLLDGAARGDQEDGYRLAREAAYRALAIDPDLAVAHARLGEIESVENADFATAAGHLNRALALDPTDLGTLEQAGALLVNLGRPEQAIEVMRHVVERDPLSPDAYYQLWRALWAAGRPEEALGASRRASELADPGRTGAIVGFALLGVGRPAEALEIFRARPEGAVRQWGLAAAYHALGRDRESDEAMAALIACCERDWSYNVAWIHATRGNVDAAFEWLEKAARYGDAGLSQIHGGYRAFEALHDDPRWIPFLEGLGLAPEQLEAIELHLPPLD
jgi:tetratricopeptide (TPR) repeat protein